MKVFLSSTYQDLKEHRECVIKMIDRLRVGGMDIQWIGMEAFGARDDSPANTCIKGVDECEIYVGFFGVRYGSIDPLLNISMTEMEYRHTVKEKKKRLLFLIDEDNADVKPKSFEKPTEALEKLRKLKEDILKDCVVDFFTTPEDLASKVSTALTTTLPKLLPQIPTSIRIPLPPNPYFVHPYPLQANFTGRKKESEMLNKWFTTATQQIFSLVAIGGMGKSSLAWVWTEKTLSSGVPVDGVFWWRFYDVEGRDFGKFLDRAIEYTSNRTVDPKSINSNRERVDELISILSQKRFLFVLDGFERVLRHYARLDAAYQSDEMSGDEPEDVRSCTDPNMAIFLKHAAGGNIHSKILITTRLMPRELDELASVTKYELTGIDPDDAVQLFHSQNIKGTHTEIEAACSVYGYHPLSLRLLAGTLIKDPRYDTDISHAPKIDLLKELQQQNIFEFAYNSLTPHQQKLVSCLSAFRSPVTWETITATFYFGAGKSINKIFTGYESENKFVDAFLDLLERGLYQRDIETNTYDFHPLVRRYCYSRLDNKKQTHDIIANYFEKFNKQDKIQTLEDLQPIIELYHHIVNAGRYDKAWNLFENQINDITHNQLGAYQLRIELLRILFPDNYKLPRLRKQNNQVGAMNALAISYERCGQSRFSLPLYEKQIDLTKIDKNIHNITVSLMNLSSIQLEKGKLKITFDNLNHCIELSNNINDFELCSLAHQNLALALIFQGDYIKAKSELKTAYEITKKGPNYHIRNICELLEGNTQIALEAFEKARYAANETENFNSRDERNIIETEWYIGASYCALDNLPDAEKHLQEALSRNRKISLVESEGSILLEFAKLRLKQSRQEDSYNFAIEALEIANRCEYRLQQADIHNFLAEYYYESLSSTGEKKPDIVKKAKDHAEKAKERAYCDGPPYYYKVAYEKAEVMLEKLNTM